MKNRHIKNKVKSDSPKTIIKKKKKKLLSVGKDVEKREHLYIVGENLNWHSHYGKWYKSFSKK